MFQAFCILEDNNKDTYKIGSNKIVPKKWMIAYLLDWANKSIKSHLKTREFLFNFKRKSIVEQVIMNTENSRKAFLQEIEFWGWRFSFIDLMDYRITKYKNKIV